MPLSWNIYCIFKPVLFVSAQTSQRKPVRQIYIMFCARKSVNKETDSNVIFAFLSLSAFLVYRNKGKAIPITGLDRPTGFQEVEASRFQDIRHMKVVRLSALCTGRLYPPGNIPGAHFC